MEDKDLFERERLAIKFCESRGVDPQTKAGIKTVDAFSAGYDAALAIGREEGRKERTVEIMKYCHADNLCPVKCVTLEELEIQYPECFEKGEG